jgi:hypothetical protein
MYRSHAGDMGQVNLVVGHRQELGLRLLLYWLAQERSWIWTRGSVSRCVVDCVGSSEIYPNLSASHERLPHMGTTRRKHTPGVCGLAWEAYVSCWSGFPLHGVHRFESL